MRKITIKLSLFIILLLIINAIIRSFVPYWWGNPGYNEKYNYLKDNHKDYNMVFLGSSRLYRHVIPEVLDKRLKNHDIKSFNMAYAGTNNPELFYLSKRLLKEDWFDFNYVIIELSPIILIGDKNFHTERVKYAMNFESLCLSLNSLNVDNKLDHKQFYKHIITYLEWLFNIGLSDNIIEKALEENDESHYKKLDNNRGYEKFSLDKRSKRYKKHLNFKKRGSTRLQKRSDSVHKIYSRYKNDTTIYNKTYLRRVEELIHIASEKEIKLIFLIPPRTGSGKTLLTTVNNIDSDNAIIIYDSKQYPQFYDMRFSWDLGHLDERGAKRFTRILAKKIKEKIDPENSTIK